MQAHIDKTHGQLGELAAMSHQTREAERKILDRAEVLLEQVEKDLMTAAGSALTSGAEDYTRLIAERGRLHQVIARARKILRN